MGGGLNMGGGVNCRCHSECWSKNHRNHAMEQAQTNVPKIDDTPRARTPAKALRTPHTPPPAALTRGLFVCTAKRHPQQSTASPRPTPPCLRRCIEVTEGGGQQVAGQSSASLEYPPRAPESRDTLDLHRPPPKRPAKFDGPEGCGNNASSCSDAGVVPAKGGGA